MPGPFPHPQLGKGPGNEVGFMPFLRPTHTGTHCIKMNSSPRKVAINEGYNGDNPTMEKPMHLKEIRYISNEDDDGHVRAEVDPSNKIYETLEGGSNWVRRLNWRYMVPVIIACLISVVALFLSLLMVSRNEALTDDGNMRAIEESIKNLTTDTDYKIRALEENIRNLTTKADKIRILEENITTLQRKLAEKSMEINNNRLSPDDFKEDVIDVCAKVLNSSNPCKNGGTCYPENERCRCKCVCPSGFVGKECEKATESCMEIINDSKDKNIGPISSQAYPLYLGSDTLPVYCHMTSLGVCRDGGWTLVMKIDGSKNTFHYDSEIWSNMTELNTSAGMTGFDEQESKLPTYGSTNFSKICLGMKNNNKTHFILINKIAESLFSLIADGEYRATSLGRNTWKSLLGSEASLQRNCNREGFNADTLTPNHPKVRIGILGNEQNDCDTCDSRLGFGGGGRHDDSNTCGNVARWEGDNGDNNIKAMGYIFVR